MRTAAAFFIGFFATSFIVPGDAVGADRVPEPCARTAAFHSHIAALSEPAQAPPAADTVSPAVIVLVGPHRTGKSVLVNEFMRSVPPTSSHVVVAGNRRSVLPARSIAQVSRAAEELRTRRLPSTYLIVEEAQELPELLPALVDYATSRGGALNLDRIIVVLLVTTLGTADPAAPVAERFAEAMDARQVLRTTADAARLFARRMIDFGNGVD